MKLCGNGVGRDPRLREHGKWKVKGLFLAVGESRVSINKPSFADPQLVNSNHQIADPQLVNSNHQIGKDHQLLILNW